MFVLSTDITEIEAYIAAKYKLTTDQTNEVITIAIQRIRQAAFIDETFERGKTRLRYELMFQQSQQIQDIQTALKATVAQQNWLAKATENNVSTNTADIMETKIREHLEPIIGQKNLTIDELLRRTTLELINQKTRAVASS